MSLPVVFELCMSSSPPFCAAPAEVPAAEPPAVEAAAPAVEPPPPIENEALLNAIKANVDAQASAEGSTCAQRQWRRGWRDVWRARAACCVMALCGLPARWCVRWARLGEAGRGCQWAVATSAVECCRAAHTRYLCVRCWARLA
eukprot:7048932-Prymnesium_polylepis.1